MTNNFYISYPGSDNIYFNGTSLVRWDLTRDPISASRESIRFRFKTSVANCVLMYSRGTQGDYFALQLRDNRMLLNIDLGKRGHCLRWFSFLPYYLYWQSFKRIYVQILNFSFCVCYKCQNSRGSCNLVL